MTIVKIPILSHVTNAATNSMLLLIQTLCAMFRIVGICFVKLASLPTLIKIMLIVEVMLLVLLLIVINKLIKDKYGN